MDNKNNATKICLLIGLCFLWTGSGYLTWMYRLLEFYPTASVDILTEVIGYIFQIIGLIGFSVCYKRRAKIFNTKKEFILAMIGDFCLISLSALAWNGPSALIFGYCMNFFHGIIAGIYLTMLVLHVSQQYRGRVFGLGYGLGSIGSWILSLVGNGNFLQSKYVLITYAILTGISIFLYYNIENMDFSDTNQRISSRQPISLKFVFLVGITLFLLSTVKNVGFYFPTADLSAGNINLEFTRAFYALGLVIAGFITDRNRKYGAVCCVAALVFPFAMLVVLADEGTSAILWVLGYVFFGFFVVYRAIVFVDLAGKSENNLFLAGLGLMFGRAGDVIGATLGICLTDQTSLLVILTAILFMITIFVFFIFYQKTYFPLLSEEKNTELLLEDFSKKYALSPREREVFSLIKEGRSNLEIAGDLYISENTVKFHIKNILKKTACSNRTELITLFKG